jgi:hypothetical protein
MPLPENALLPLEEQETALVIATAAPATKITTVTLPDTWTRRFVRMTFTNRDNAVRLLSLYAGDTVDTDRTLIKNEPLSNYQKISYSEDDLKKLITKFTAGSGATTGQNVNLYGLIDGVTVGIQVDVTYIDELL